ncbi:MAG: hypothetical protein R6V46_11310 [Desulfatiglandaceae bacterium]
MAEALGMEVPAVTLVMAALEAVVLETEVPGAVTAVAMAVATVGAMAVVTAADTAAETGSSGYLSFR